MCGATMKDVFLRILAPLLVPGILAAAILVLVRTVGMFELTFLVSGPRTDTLVVAIYRAMTSAGGAEARRLVRSEEHTSELQSRGHLVCRLLLEIKKVL